jgi:hypothetical protein
VPFASKRHHTPSPLNSAAVGAATGTTSSVTTAGNPSTQDTDAAQHVNADATLRAATGTTGAALAAATGKEQGQDSTRGEQLHVLAVNLNKAQCVRHTRPSS